MASPRCDAFWGSPDPSDRAARGVRSDWTETGHLQVVVHPAIRLRQRIVLSREKLLLIVVAGSPGQYRADVERLAQDLAHHVFGQHAFRRVLIVRAPGRVDMVIAGKPTDARRVDPSFESDGELAGPG